MKHKIKIILIILAIILIVVMFFVFKKDDSIEYVTAKVVKGDLVQTVSETGTVKAVQEIELNFLQSGKINNLLVQVGEKVKKDQILIELDYSSSSIKEQDAEASLEIAKANLQKLLTGATSHEIAVNRANVKQAKASYLSAVDELAKAKSTVAEDIRQAEKKLNDLNSKDIGNVTPYEQALITAENSLKNTKETYQQSIDNKIDIAILEMEEGRSIANTALDKIDRVINDDDAKNYLSLKDLSYLNNTKETYNQSFSLKIPADDNLSIAKNNSSVSNINNATDTSVAYLNKVYESLNYCYGALENTVTSATFTKTELDALKTSISTQQSNVNTQISSLQTAQQNLFDAVLDYNSKVASAEDSLATAKANLDDALITANNQLATARTSGDQKISSAQAKVDTSKEAWGVTESKLDQLLSKARNEDVVLARAQVKQAEASLALTKKQVEDSIIKAPMDGTITKIEYEIGEQIIMTKPAIFMLAENNFEIEIDISEADISKIKVGNPTEITLDAFGDDLKFQGKVLFIEPAETIIQDVVYYKVKIEFSKQENSDINLKRVKSGMTANAIIITAEKKDTLLMPSRAIVEKNGLEKIVRVLKDGAVEEKEIKIGLRGDEGLVEVLLGVEEGEVVVTFVKDKK